MIKQLVWWCCFMHVGVVWFFKKRDKPVLCLLTLSFFEIACKVLAFIEFMNPQTCQLTLLLFIFPKISRKQNDCLQNIFIWCNDFWKICTSYIRDCGCNLKHIKASMTFMWIILQSAVEDTYVVSEITKQHQTSLKYQFCN